ncbi:MAG: SDR family NAD(P)-dependent oxidoreductase, partial [Oceanospirillales bacterium]|nr:SDR family NAD(P)-dependent oxidoreductase [Oceanospirillales bacterium]
MRAERFKNKVAVVTGAAQGIGRAVALQMAVEKASLLLVDRSEIIKEVAEEALAAGAAAVQTINVDLEQYAGACKAIDAAVSHFGRIDILVNNVGGTIWA